MIHPPTSASLAVAIVSIVSEWIPLVLGVMASQGREGAVGQGREAVVRAAPLYLKFISNSLSFQSGFVVVLMQVP